MNMSRRSILRHGALLAGGAAVSPLLHPFLARAAAEAAGKAPPKRFVFVVKSSGLTPAELVPAEMQKERVHVGEASKAGDNYKAAASLKPTDALIDRPLADLPCIRP